MSFADGTPVPLSKDRVAGNFSYSTTHIWIVDLEKQLGEDFLSLR